MADQPRSWNEGIWKRASADTWRWLQSPYFWFFNLLVGIITTATGDWRGPRVEALIFTAALGSVITATFVWHAVRAPFRQRDEARARLEELTTDSTPIEIIRAIKQLEREEIRVGGGGALVKPLPLLLRLEQHLAVGCSLYSLDEGVRMELAMTLPAEEVEPTTASLSPRDTAYPTITCFRGAGLIEPKTRENPRRAVDFGIVESHREIWFFTDFGAKVASAYKRMIA